MPSSACQKCARSEEHTSELQSHSHLVCRLLLEKAKAEAAAINATDELTDRLAGANIAPDEAVSLFVSALLFFNDTATTEIYTLSLHDALPILNSSHTLISYAVFCLRDESVTGV